MSKQSLEGQCEHKITPTLCWAMLIKLAWDQKN